MQAIVLRTDVTAREELAALVDSAVEQFGTVDVLVNNAGIFFNAAFHEMTNEEWDRMFAVNVTAVFVASQLVIRHWLAQKRGGSIVNLASISAAIAFTNSSAWSSRMELRGLGSLSSRSSASSVRGPGRDTER